MTIGPGKYDDLIALVMEKAKAKGVILVVFGGEEGDGFSCHADLITMSSIPGILEYMAKSIRGDLVETLEKVPPKGSA